MSTLLLGQKVNVCARVYVVLCIYVFVREKDFQWGISNIFCNFYFLKIIKGKPKLMTEYFNAVFCQHCEEMRLFQFYVMYKDLRLLQRVIQNWTIASFVATSLYMQVTNTRALTLPKNIQNKPLLLHKFFSKCFCYSN